ncbi:AraC family transcriptional regulator [Mucilaginibacter pedocola]|uniref:AraC family transcriptional regulator n=1 Tax=Mucilaginibacter pedocola TaxID=1792845 RepID=A0A1S9PGJ1_9SPHI|nr:AraC family transcriptional regulator [Mucilaginibacter pedocola]OOQ60062.1 AraC family transcriptional regulator [Mucilaginibacter pedocola]
MRRYVLHNPFSIYHFEAAEWTHSVHKHTYFEVIFILKGKGMHHINGSTFGYEAGDVFLLGPEDFHYFDIEELTEFSFVRFNEHISKTTAGDKEAAWQPIIKTLLNTSSQSRGSIVTDKAEKQKLHHLLAVLEQECENERSQYFEVVRDTLMRSILVILARSLSGQDSVKPILKESVERMLSYVKEHINNRGAIKIESLAATFNYAPAYISLFFKRHTGESLKQFIIKHKIKLIEAQLQYGQRSLSEIAFEFGYTDESHFSKQFRKYTGTTPSAFRKNI